MKLDGPQNGDRLQAAAPSDAVLHFLANRRSSLAKMMRPPGPDSDQLNLILRLAARVPDHRKLTPWRFIVFQGETRSKFGSILASRFHDENPEMAGDRIQFEGERFLRAPIVVAVVSSPKNCPRGTPLWEQQLSAGAVCQNMLLAARASGFAAQWITEWYAYDAEIGKALGLADQERVAGFIYMGTATDAPMERPRPEMSTITKLWGK